MKAMVLKKILVALFWFGIIVAPVAITYVVLVQMPQGVEIPLHWNAQHKIDRYGSPWEMFPWPFLLSACNLLIALCYAFADRLFNMGLVHGVSRKGMHPFLCGIAVLVLVIWIGVLAIWIYQIKQAGF